VAAKDQLRLGLDSAGSYSASNQLQLTLIQTLVQNPVSLVYIVYTRSYHSQVAIYYNSASAI